MRIQFEFSDDAVRNLDTLKNRLNVNARGYVLNHSLGLLKWLIKEKDLGSKIILTRSNGSTVEVIFPEIESLLLGIKS